MSTCSSFVSGLDELDLYLVYETLVIFSVSAGISRISVKVSKHNIEYSKQSTIKISL